MPSSAFRFAILAALGAALSSPSALEAKGPRFVATSAGTLRDAKTRLEWTASDGGVDITWRDAGKRCAGLGDGWRLPTALELQGLHDPKATRPCGTYECHVDPQFQLSNVYAWSGTSAGDDATIVGLADGDAVSIYNGPSHHYPALCVNPGKPAAAPATKK